jgi:acyl carrier protein
LTDADRLLEAMAEEYRELKGTRRLVRAGDRLDADLDIDSLLAQELLAGLEDRFGIELIGDPRLVDVRTAGDLVDVIAATMEPAR